MILTLARDAEERGKWIGALENTVVTHSHSKLRVRIVCLKTLMHRYRPILLFSV